MYEESPKIGLRPHAGPQAPKQGSRSPAKTLGALFGELARDRWMLAVLLLALGLQLFTLSRIEGYLLADSVEYMDRAAQVAGGATLDSTTVRSFAFSGLLTPLFWLVHVLGAPDTVAVGLSRALVMLLGLLAIWVTMRLGMRLFGRPAGLVAGFMLATNPILLQYGVEPLTGSAAALAIALALEAATREPGSSSAARRGAATGAWLGVALLFAFKTIPIAGIVFLGLFLAGPLRERLTWMAALAAYLAFALGQCLLDLAVYGTFGGSLLAYLRANVGGVLGDVLLKLHGAGVPGMYEAAAKVYAWTYGSGPGGGATAETVGDVMRTMTTKTWYLEHFTSSFLAWPLTIALVLGLAAALTKRRRGALLCVAIVLFNFAFLSIKSAKSFRLFLPLLPAMALVAGLGASAVFAQLRRVAGARLSLAAGALALGWALVAGQLTLSQANLTKYGAWWRAVDELEGLAQEDGRPWTYASAYNWAVRFRAADDLELVKLPHHMDRWESLDSDQRQETLAALSGLDGFLAHLQIMTQDPRILATVNERFEIHDILYDAKSFEELGPLYIMKRRSDKPAQRSFFELTKGVDPGAYQASISHAHSVDYRRRERDGTLQMVLLGWDLETGLAGGQIAWLTLHWYIGNTAGHDYTIVTRLTDRDDRARDGNHEPAHGAWPTSKLEPGWILAESLEIPLPLDPEVFGGADARGDLIPASFWLGITEYVENEDGTLSQPGGLNPFQPSGQRPLQKGGSGGRRISPDGYRWSKDGLFGVAGFWLPVPEGGKLADDGKPIGRKSDRPGA